MTEHEHAWDLSGLAPHSACLLGEPVILHLMLWSNLGIALAYLLIPLGLQILRPSLLAVDTRVATLFPDADPKGVGNIRRSMIVCFQAFILACASTHIMNAVTLYWPLYLVSSVSHVTTAVISLSVAAAFLVAGYRLSR